MRVIIAGSRDIKTVEPVYRAIKSSGYVITEIVSGGARGVDTLGELWGEIKNIPVKVFPADWDKYGRAAGPIRNQEMADYCDAAIFIWDGKSAGTKNCIECVSKLKKPYIVETYSV